MYHHAIRITLPYEDCSGIISLWADRCNAVVVYQHDADEEISKTHVHIGLLGCETKSEALKRMWKDAPGKGNEFWSWKDWDGEDKYLTYMSKGTLRAKYVKNISEDRLEKSRQSWVEPVKAAKSGDQSEFYIDMVLAQYTNVNSLQRFTEDIAFDEGTCPWSFERVLSDVRLKTMKMFYRFNRKVPPASLYKMVAGTAFLRLCEKWNYLDNGIEALKNLWY